MRPTSFTGSMVSETRSVADLVREQRADADGRLDGAGERRPRLRHAQVERIWTPAASIRYARIIVGTCVARRRS